MSDSTAMTSPLSSTSPATHPDAPRSRSPRRKWTSAEDEKLRALVAQYGDARGSHGHWKDIALGVPGRTPKDCRKRWFHSLDPSLRKGRWTEHEDRVLLSAHARLGPAWHDIALLIPGRKDDQCSKRYNEILDPAAKTRLRGWTPGEDRVLAGGVRCLGHRWSAISARLVNRPPLTCRNRWRHLSERWKVAESGAVAAGGSPAGTTEEASPGGGVAREPIDVAATDLPEGDSSALAELDAILARDPAREDSSFMDLLPLSPGDGSLPSAEVPDMNMLDFPAIDFPSMALAADTTDGPTDHPSTTGNTEPSPDTEPSMCPNSGATAWNARAPFPANEPYGGRGAHRVGPMAAFPAPMPPDPDPPARMAQRRGTNPPLTPVKICTETMVERDQENPNVVHHHYHHHHHHHYHHHHHHHGSLSSPNTARNEVEFA